MGVLEKIPTFLITGVLVIVFVCLKRHARSGRLTLWTVGWTLVFTHFLAQLLEPDHGPVNYLLSAIDAGSLQAAAVAFLVSVCSAAEDRAKRTLLLLVLGVPSVAYAICTGYNVQARWPYILCLAACFSGAVCFFFELSGKLRGKLSARLSLRLAAATLPCSLAAAWAIAAALGGSLQVGTIAFIGIGFGLAGVLICRSHGKLSPAILTIAGGFFSWGAAFPIRLLIDRLTPSLIIPGELWNTSKIFVAFGMILAVVEDKSESIAGMQHKADRLDRRLERFSEITSRLLSGAELDTICPAVASAITDVSTFSIAVLQLENTQLENARLGDIQFQNAGRGLRIAGASGLSPEALQRLEAQTQDWTLDHIKRLCSTAQLMGKNSYLLPPHEAILFALRENPDAQWASGEEILIPLCADGGAYLGCIRLAAPRDARTIHALELCHIERLATDIALAVELQSLHAQLVCSEKLAALGQLLAGVAHELNNPLTAIMGFGELIDEAVAAPQARDQLAKLVGEARRMNRMIDNVLRFSRQGARDTQTAQLAPVVQQVLALREYYTRTRNVRVVLDIVPDLPLLAVSEDEIKQILLNLLNNASDALEGRPGTKQISIRAYRNGPHVVIEVEDTGPGFGNLNRAMHPFYTTKPAGKGTGLGLSVCCGIARKRGGDLEIENVKPHGARVTIKFLVADAPAAPLLAAVARA
jgi:two-component system NtrC family sensor kinase